MGNTIRQRLTTIKVREISLVDRPANEMEFVVVKRQEEELGMSKTGDQQVAGNAAQTPNGNAEAVSAPTGVDGLKDLTKQVQDLAALLQPKDEKPAEGVTEGGVQTPVTKTEGASDGSPSGGANADPIGELSNAVAALTNVVKGLLPKPQTETPAPATEVEKSILSPARLERLRKGVTEMLTLMKDIDPDGVASLLSAPAAPAAPAAGSAPSPAAPDVEASLQKALAPVVGQFEAIVKRLGDVEALTGVSKSVGGDGNDGNVQKGESIFKGVV